MRSLTPKQQKLAGIMASNMRAVGTTKTKAEMLKEAGYSTEMQKHPGKAMQSPTLQQALAETIKTMNDKRRLALYHITEDKLKKTNALNLGYLADIMTKNIQLLSGNETERKGITVEISEVIARKNHLATLVDPIQEAIAIPGEKQE